MDSKVGLWPIIDPGSRRSLPIGLTTMGDTDDKHDEFIVLTSYRIR